MNNLQIELFLLLTVGYCLGKKGVLDCKTRNKLTELIIWVVIPCSVIQSFQMQVSVQILTLILQIFIIACFIQLLYWIINQFWWNGFNEDERVLCKYSTMVTNASFIGLPIVLSLFGSEAVLYVSFFVIPQRILMWTYGVPLYTKLDKKEALKNALKHPCVLSVGIGIVLMVLYSNGILLPQSVRDTISALGCCSIGLSMLVTGSIISEIKLKELIDGRVITFCLCRLLVFPILIMAILHFFPIDEFVGKICIIMSAMPTPVTMVVLAQQYDRNPHFASKMMFMSTIISMITLPVILGLLNI